MLEVAELRLAGGGVAHQLDRRTLLRTLRLARHRTVQAGGDHGHAHFVLHVRIQHGADHHGGVLGGEAFDGAADLVELGHGEVRAGGDVDQDAVGAGQVDVVQQRVLDRRFGGGLRAVVAAGRAGAHHRQAHFRHHGAHVGEVDVDQARTHDQVGDALHRALQHVVGGAERLDHGGVAAEHGDQLFIRNGDQRVAVLAQFLDALQRHLHAAAALERERLGDHGHGQDAHFLGQLRHHRRGAGAGAAAHAGGDEHHVRALQRVHDALAVFQRGLAADFRVRARAQALGDVGAELQLQLGAAVLDRLRVGVGGDELHAVHAAADHVRDRVAAAAAHANDLDHCIGCHLFNQFEMRHVRFLFEP
ncbi:hypothetical protein NB689_002821 [Xanthomonas sacchari]|nr:hypothetical protein [Xanthomonas sacchari]